MILTDKQENVLTVIVKGNSNGSFCDLDEIIQRVFYETNKPSIQFIIRNLISKGMIEKQETQKRRARRRIILCATKSGYEFISRKRTSTPEVMSRVLTRELIGEV